MIILALLLSVTGFAQTIDLSAVRELDEELPSYEDFKNTDEEIKFQRNTRRYLPPVRPVKFKEIEKSETQLGALKKGAILRSIDTNKTYRTTKLMYVRYYGREDEQGFKYILSEDKTVSWKVNGDDVEPIKEELSLYEPPLKYTPAPTNIVRAEYDRKLSLLPEVSFYTGFVVGDYMKDLFDDKKARHGTTTQYALHAFTQWNLPVKIGGVFHYERTTYELKGDRLVYSSASFGPQIKSRDFDFMNRPLRAQMQIRVSPFARAQTENGGQNLKFNSTDLLVSLETPVKNRFGEFVLGFFFQNQWLNVKEQTNIVNIRASNETNKAIGLSFAQVFE